MLLITNTGVPYSTMTAQILLDRHQYGETFGMVEDSCSLREFPREFTEAQAASAKAQIIAKFPKVAEVLYPDFVYKVCSSYIFAKRFTQAERISIAQSTDPYVKDFWTLAAAAQDADMANTDTIAGMAYLVQAGLITQQRQQEIMDL